MGSIKPIAFKWKKEDVSMPEFAEDEIVIKVKNPSISEGSVR